MTSEGITKEDQEAISVYLDAIEKECKAIKGAKVKRQKIDVAEFITLTYTEAVVTVDMHFLGLGRNVLMVDARYLVRFGGHIPQARKVAEEVYELPQFFGRMQFDDKDEKIVYRWHVLVPDNADLENFAEGLVECAMTDVKTFLRQMAKHCTPDHIKKRVADFLGKKGVLH